MTDGHIPFSVEEATEHLRRTDPRMPRLIDRFGPYTLRPRGEPFHALVRSILFQQLAGAAASAIMRRFLRLYSEDGIYPTPEQLAKTSEEDLRSVGLSRQKTAYLLDLAQRVVDGRLDLADVHELADEELMRQLTSVKGIGEWTTHMFMMFQLGRPDVMPVGDLGVRRGMAAVYSLPATPTPKEAAEIGRPWTPFRSVGSWYMWRVVETPLPEWE